MRKTIVLLASIASLAICSAASAAEFLFTFSSNLLDLPSNGAFGTLTATANGNGSFTATSGTINAFGNVATGTGALIPNPNAPALSNSPMGGFIFDDLALPGMTPLITNGGLLFSINGREVNIFSDTAVPGGYSFYSANPGGGYTFANGTFALSEIPAVPESATWVMMLVGFGMVGAGIRSRKRQEGKRPTVRVTYA